MKGGTCGWDKKVQELLKLVLLLNSHCELQSYGRVSCPPRKKGGSQQFSKLIHLKMSQVLGSVSHKVILVLRYGGLGKVGGKLLGLRVPQTL